MATCTDAEACAARLLLGLPAEEMNFDKIRKAYLKASLRYHPDKAARHGFTEAEATDAMQVRVERVTYIPLHCKPHCKPHCHLPSSH